jgi:hypothetical protein
VQGLPADGTVMPKHIALIKHYTIVYDACAFGWFSPLKAELNPICHFLALLGGATIVVVSRLRVNERK